MDSREKGKRGEREVRDVLLAWGIAARRGRQFNGLEGKDVVTAMEGVHVEATLRGLQNPILTAKGKAKLAQAVADAGDDLPALFHRGPREPWLLTLRASDFPALVQAYLDAKGDERR